MGRRSKFVFRHRQLLTPRPVRRLVLLSAVFVLVLGASAVFAQDAPPPPPDVPAASPAAPPSAAPDASSTTEPPTASSVRAVRLSDVEGQVQVFQGDQLAFDQAEPNMPAVEGMRFVTGNNGRLEIEFEDGSVARVAPNSSLCLRRLDRSADGTTITRIDALTGLSYYELNDQGGQYSVHFGPDTATPQGSAVFRIGLDNVPSELAVMHGGIHVVDDGGGVSVDIHPNQTFQTDPQQGGEFTVAQSIDADSWDQWNSDRDEALAQLESAQTTARASSGNPDDPAWNDLDYYGDWYNLPGYGQVWSPSGVGQDWDPFGNGYWGYYNSWGYTWISGYPWGWWPYHCGAWSFLSSFGWIWVPGNCGFGAYGAGWFPYATVWNVPHGYIPPARPHNAPRNPRFHPQPMIAVNRGPQFAAPFRQMQGNRPDPRPLTFEGRTINPLETSMHPQQKGPVGDSFTTTFVRTHPEMTAPAAPGSSGLRSPYPQFRPLGPIRTLEPPRTTVPSSGVHPGVSHPSAPAGGTHVNSGGSAATASHH